MTPEERYDKIDERIDAIARNLELLSHMHTATEGNLDRLAEAQKATEEKLDRLAEAQKVTDEKLQQFINTVNDGLTRFAHILANHDDRIERLEGNRPQH